MKKFNFARLLFAFLLVVSTFSIVRAQAENASAVPNKQAARENRPNLLKELGLLEEQRQQIRRVNLEKRQFAQDARARLDEANANLDRAIYANNLNEAEVQAKMKEVHTAQQELLKIRSTNELAIRKILTVEQLVKFRNLRERFERQTQSNSNRPRTRPNQNTDSNASPRLKIRQRVLRRGN